MASHSGNLRAEIRSYAPDIVSLVDLDSYRVTTHDIYSSHIAKAGMGANTAYSEDIANAALWLGSDQSSFATGQTFTNDGGLTAASPLQPGLY
jgi:NAD(P)-dependent dehydrogenase (short-subunit alcohol dehydrogenase family)